MFSSYSQRTRKVAAYSGHRLPRTLSCRPSALVLGVVFLSSHRDFFLLCVFSSLFQPLASLSGDPAHTSLKAQKSVLVILLQC